MAGKLLLSFAFLTQDKRDLRVHFDSFDADGDGHITADEVTQLMQTLGEK